LGEVGEAVPPRAGGRQTEGCSYFACIADIKTLIAWARRRVAYHWFRAGYARDFVHDVEQADGVTGTTTKVEGLSAATLDVAIGANIGFDGVRDVENVANLPAVAEDGYRFSREAADQEVRNPALIFVAALPRSVNATHAKDSCGDMKRACVVDDVLIGRTFGTSVGCVKIEALAFINAEFSDLRISG
jgi:hypothetical protein